VSQSELKVATVVSYPFEENTYIAHLAGRKDCLVFDPGLEPDKILEILDRDGLTPAALMITHGHGDHIGGIAELKDRWPDCPIVIGANEANKLTDAHLNLTAQFGMPVVAPPADVLLNEGDVYEAAGMKLEVQEIPGHSTGHVVYIWKDHQPYYVFGGDVLFAGSVGRCDLPQGSFAKLAQGIQQKLFTLPDDTVVLSGHGPPTTTGREKLHNPFVGRASGEG